MLKNIVFLFSFASIFFISENPAEGNVLKKFFSTRNNVSQLILCTRTKLIKEIEIDKENTPLKKNKKILLLKKNGNNKKRSRGNDYLHDQSNSPYKRRKKEIPIVSSDRKANKVIIPDESTKTKKRAPENDYLHDQNNSPSKRRKKKIPIVSSDEKVISIPVGHPSPVTRERIELSKVREKLVQLEYPEENGKKHAVASPLVRQIYHDNGSGTHWTRVIVFKGKTVYQVDSLFDPNDQVLVNGIWKTNLDLMKEGRCPISYKGIATEEERKTLTAKAIEQKQRLWRVELHHVTQKDTGTDQDPLIEVTYVAHMGKNDRFILEYDTDSETMGIIHSNLEKGAAIRLLKADQFLVTNTLHFRKDERSHIDRDEFDPWRKKYWIDRAAEIEMGNYISRDKHFLHPLPIRLFSPSLEEKKARSILQKEKKPSINASTHLEVSDQKETLIELAS